jgi:hypothetical protein
MLGTVTLRRAGLNLQQTGEAIQKTRDFGFCWDFRTNVPCLQQDYDHLNGTVAKLLATKLGIYTAELASFGPDVRPDGMQYPSTSSGKPFGGMCYPVRLNFDNRPSTEIMKVGFSSGYGTLPEFFRTEFPVPSVQLINEGVHPTDNQRYVLRLTDFRGNGWVNKQDLDLQDRIYEAHDQLTDLFSKP